MEFDVKEFEKAILEQYNKTFVELENENPAAEALTSLVKGTSARMVSIAIAEYHERFNSGRNS